VANTLDLLPNGAVGFIDWLDVRSPRAKLVDNDANPYEKAAVHECVYCNTCDEHTQQEERMGLKGGNKQEATRPNVSSVRGKESG
jgi:hypothetical protein